MSLTASLNRLSAFQRAQEELTDAQQDAKAAEEWRATVETKTRVLWDKLSLEEQSFANKVKGKA